MQKQINSNFSMLQFTDLKSDTNEILNNMGVKHSYVLADSNHRTINVFWRNEDKKDNKSDIKSDKNEMKKKIE